MFPCMLFIKLLLVHHATQSPTETRASCSDDVSLRCPGVDFDSLHFRSVTWYKLFVQNSQNKQGIIRRDKDAEVPYVYSFTRPVNFTDKYSLFLSRVTPEDSGSYECYISAKVGGRNLNLKVDLIVDACMTEAALTTVTNMLNSTRSNLPCQKHVEDLPAMWSCGGYVAVGITKIILSLISIWVIRRIHTRSSRRQRHLWGN